MDKKDHMIWLSGDSWLDWRSLTRSGVRFDDSIEGRLQNDHYQTLSFARGSSGNLKQLDLIQRYSLLNVKFPDYWIHSWTEVGRDIDLGAYPKNSLTDVTLYTANKIVEISDMLKCKVLVFGGQAPIPKIAQDILGDRVFIVDWKAEILGTTEYGASQYFSLVVEQPFKVPKKQLRKEANNAFWQLDILTKSTSFPDNAHPGIKEYNNLYNTIIQRFNKDNT
jgi:hypothetical protein